MARGLGITLRQLGFQTYYKDQAQLLRRRPFHGMLFVFIRRVIGRGYIISQASSLSLKCALLNEDIRNEAVDNRGTDLRIRPRP